jgi:uncharacterized protein (DUF433 family)
MEYKHLITIEPGKRSGQPCIRGLRMTVRDVLEYLAAGMSVAEILADFPNLTEEDIRACLAFAADRERRLWVIPATQREALAVLAELCELSSDVRLGQLLAHLGFLGEDQTGRTLWDIDDEQLLAVLYHHRAELIARQPTGATHPASQTPTASEATPAAEL